MQSTELDSLNPEQREAVVHTDGPLLILAGAGSGKTRVITYRIAHLIGEGFAAPDQVLAVTFTNKAAEEMRHRVEQLVGEERRPVWMSTFHSLCARLLRREAPAIGLTRDFVIYDSSDQIAVVKQALKSLDIDDKFIQPRAALSRISHAKNKMETPADLQQGWGLKDQQIAKVYERYLRVLSDAGALDFDDLLLKTVEMFETNEHIREVCGRRFKYVMVDEYQDTNRPQYMLIKRLVEQHRNLCVVGDPDQSIYKWRGADMKNILDFERDFPEATVVRLEQNYRSTQVILDAASSVIRRNTGRKEKALWTKKKGGEQIVYMRAGDEIEEADFITRAVREARLFDSKTLVAVLYRTNSQSRAIEDALMREGVPYKIIGGVRFYERKEIKDVLAYLRLVINPHDDVSFRRVVNVPSRGIGKVVMDALDGVNLEASDELPPLLAAGLDPVVSRRSMWSRMHVVLEQRLVQPRAIAALKSFRDTIVALAGEAPSAGVHGIIAKTLEDSGYLKDLKDERTDDAEARIENLMELVSAAGEYEGRDPEASIGGFVDRLSLLSEADEEDGAKEDARVWMMSMHAAKGLEFPIVIVAGMEDGLFPHARALQDEEDIEEERRIFYVCITRARERLFLTSASRRRIFGEYKPTEPSRFLDEVPPELVRRIEPVASTPSWAARGGSRGYEMRNPYARRPGSSGAGSGAPRSGLKEAPAKSYAYEDEDQSASGVRNGQRVRHKQFGVGTVVGVEEHGDDFKITVQFSSVGTKKLIGKYANLEPA
jgi:DNA helicase-2/ATP-dependent DNA helicase PcrA